MLTSLVSLQQGNVKKSEKSMKIVNTKGENVHMIWMAREMSMKFSGKMWLMIILKVTQKTDPSNLLRVNFLNKFLWIFDLRLVYLRKKFQLTFPFTITYLPGTSIKRLGIFSSKCSFKAPHKILWLKPSIRLSLWVKANF